MPLACVVPRYRLWDGAFTRPLFCFCGQAAAGNAKRTPTFCRLLIPLFDVWDVCGSIGLCGRSLRLAAFGLLFRLCGLLLFFLRQPKFNSPNNLNRLYWCRSSCGAPSHTRSAGLTLTSLPSQKSFARSLLLESQFQFAVS